MAGEAEALEEAPWRRDAVAPKRMVEVGEREGKGGAVTVPPAASVAVAGAGVRVDNAVSDGTRGLGVPPTKGEPVLDVLTRDEAVGSMGEALALALALVVGMEGVGGALPVGRSGVAVLEGDKALVPVPAPPLDNVEEAEGRGLLEELVESEASALGGALRVVHGVP